MALHVSLHFFRVILLSFSNSSHVSLLWTLTMILSHRIVSEQPLQQPHVFIMIRRSVINLSIDSLSHCCRFANLNLSSGSFVSPIVYFSNASKICCTVLSFSCVSNTKPSRILNASSDRQFLRSTIWSSLFSLAKSISRAQFDHLFLNVFQFSIKFPSKHSGVGGFAACLSVLLSSLILGSENQLGLLNSDIIVQSGVVS